MTTPPRRAWNRVAAVYDGQLALERAALAAAVDLARPLPEEALLDVGTGTGAVLGELSRRPARPRAAVGVDSSPRMLAAASPLPGGWRLLEADARRLPFGDGSFDVVIAAYLLHVLEPADRARVLEEIARVLSPAGRLVTVTPALPRTRLGRALFGPVARAAQRSSGLAAGLRALDPTAEIDQFLTVERVRWVNRGYPSLCVLARARGDLTDARRASDAPRAPCG